jgi:predicted polyphosphate/ATP-dependent NAD kinase
LSTENTSPPRTTVSSLPAKRIGLIVNPVAGMGGAVGLKGTDGKSIVNQAISLGAKPVAPARAEAFLFKLNPFKNSLRLFVGAGRMGEDEAITAGFTCTVLGEQKEETSAEDTVAIAKKLVVD